LEPGENERLKLRKQLKAELNELVFYKIEMPSASSNKKIISCIERIIEIINVISSANEHNQTDKQIHSSPNKSGKNSNEVNKDEYKQAKFKDFIFYEVKLMNKIYAKLKFYN